MTHDYSAKTGEFYDSRLHQMLPDDAVEIGELGDILATRKYVDETVQKNRGEIEQTVQEHYITHEQGEERFRFPEREEGHQILPSGLILQWGMAEIKVNAANDIQNEIRFPLRFPNAVLTIQMTQDATDKEAHEIANVIFAYKKIDNTKFYVRADWFMELRDITLMSWFALGY